MVMPDGEGFDGAFWRGLLWRVTYGGLLGAAVGCVVVWSSDGLDWWIAAATALLGSAQASKRFLLRDYAGLAFILAAQAGFGIGSGIALLGYGFWPSEGGEDNHSVVLWVGGAAGVLLNVSITLWQFLAERHQAKPRRKRGSAGAIIGAVVDGIVDGTARLETVVGGALAIAFAALLAWAIWWLWRNTMPGPEWEWVRVVYMAVLVIFLWLGAASFVVGLKQLRRGFKGAPDLDNQRVHGRADLADEEQAARAARKSGGRGGNPDLDY
jgi:hypothetical protein